MQNIIKTCDNPNKKSWIRKQIENEHADTRNKCEFEWKVINSFRKPMQRQLSEAVYIHNTDKNEVLNLKNEYFSNNIKGLELANSEEEITCNSCGRKFQRDQFEEHLTAVHRRYNCTKCDYISFGDRDMKNHTTIKHTV